MSRAGGSGGGSVELQRDKTVGDMSPRSKQLLRDAETYLRDKLRNSFQQVLANCEKLDVLNTGTLDREAFRTALSRSFACRLTDGEFEAFHIKYHRTPKVWVRMEFRPIDLVKVRALFHDMMGNNDLENPETRKLAEVKKAEAEKYMKQQLRLNYKAIFRCFRALDLENTSSLPLEQFRRVLSRYGGMRFTPDEWWGFSKLVDTNNDGCISLAEFEALFQGFDDGSELARGRQLGDFVSAEHVEAMVAQAFAERLGEMEKMLQTMDLMLRGEIRADHFRRTFIRSGLVLSDPEAEALVAKYTIGDGNANIDYIRFLHNIRDIVRRAERADSATSSPRVGRGSTAGSPRALGGGTTSPRRLGTASPRRLGTASPRRLGTASPRRLGTGADGNQTSRSPRRALPSRHGVGGSGGGGGGGGGRRELTPREQQQLLAAARKTGRLPTTMNTARGAARIPMNGMPPAS